MVQITTKNSFGGRIINSLWGILIGLGLIIGAFILIFWNEHHGLRMAQALQQTQAVLITTPDAPINPANEAHAVYLHGLATTKDILKDRQLQYEKNAIKLDRHVEMYQWEEKADKQTESNVGGSETEVTHYTYHLTWSDTLIPSNEFKDPKDHQNPTRMPINSAVQYASHVTVGDFSLTKELVTSITPSETVNTSTFKLEKLAKELNKPLSHEQDTLYFGKDPNAPSVGDIKITLTQVLPQQVSVIAQQFEKTLQPYLAPAGLTVSLLEPGIVSPGEMISNAENANAIMTWLLRAASLIMIIVGIMLVLGPLAVLADVLPFFGSLVSAGTGLVAFIAGLILWSIALAIAWFAVRPLLAIGILIVASLVSFGILKYKKTKTQ